MSVQLYHPPSSLNFTAKQNQNSRANKHYFKIRLLFFFGLYTAGCMFSGVNDVLQYKIEKINQEMTITQDFKMGFKTAVFLI
jgi:hypothetical protein